MKLIETLWKTIRKHSGNTIEIPGKHPWKTLETPLKCPQTSLKHPLTSIDSHWLPLKLFNVLWHFKCTTYSKDTKNKHKLVHTSCEVEYPWRLRSLPAMPQRLQHSTACLIQMPDGVWKYVKPWVVGLRRPTGSEKGLLKKKWKRLVKIAAL